MEWYDFSIFGFMAIYPRRRFSPASDPTTSLIQTYGVFAAGFFMRPIGAMLIGDLGDRLGRRPALVVSVVMMAVPTVLDLGILPTYATAKCYGRRSCCGAGYARWRPGPAGLWRRCRCDLPDWL